MPCQVPGRTGRRVKPGFEPAPGPRTGRRSTSPVGPRKVAAGRPRRTHPGRSPRWGRGPGMPRGRTRRTLQRTSLRRTRERWRRCASWPEPCRSRNSGSNPPFGRQCPPKVRTSMTERTTRKVRCKVSPRSSPVLSSWFVGDPCVPSAQARGNDTGPLGATSAAADHRHRLDVPSVGHRGGAADHRGDHGGHDRSHHGGVPRRVRGAPSRGRSHERARPSPMPLSTCWRSRTTTGWDR